MNNKLCFKDKDNLIGVIQASEFLLSAVEVENIMGLPICNHPYTDSTFAAVEKDGKPELVDITQGTKGYNTWKEKWFALFRKTETVRKLYSYVRNPYKLTFIQLALPYLTRKTFSELLSDAWVMEENPSMDANVKPKEVIKWFRECIPDKLMTEDELKVYNSLEDSFTIYRGVAVGRNPNGLSWTKNKNTATWFAHRFDNHSDSKGYVQSAIVSKTDVLAYFNSRNEDELVIDVFAITGKIQKGDGE